MATCEISHPTKAAPAMVLERARAKGKILGRSKFSDGDKLVLPLETGESWHRVSKVAKIPYSTVKKHARALGYEPKRRVTALTAEAK
jgi:hypothetical protein